MPAPAGAVPTDCEMGIRAVVRVLPDGLPSGPVYVVVIESTVVEHERRGACQADEDCKAACRRIGPFSQVPDKRFDGECLSASVRDFYRMRENSRREVPLVVIGVLERTAAEPIAALMRGEGA